MLWALKPISHGLRAEAEGRGERHRRRAIAQRRLGASKQAVPRPSRPFRASQTLSDYNLVALANCVEVPSLSGKGIAPSFRLKITSSMIII